MQSFGYAVAVSKIRIDNLAQIGRGEVEGLRRGAKVAQGVLAWENGCDRSAGGPKKAHRAGMTPTERQSNILAWLGRVYPHSARMFRSALEIAESEAILTSALAPPPTE